MSTRFHDEPEDDSSSFWNKDPVSVRSSVWSSVWSRPRRWLLPALGCSVLAVFILAFGVRSGVLSSRLGSLEDTVSNLSVSLSSAHRDSGVAVKDVRRLRVSAESNTEHLGAAAEALKQLSAVESLRKAVSSLRCALDRIIHNRTESEGCCPLQWKHLDSSCYFFSQESMAWHDARDWCHAHQSQLLVLTYGRDWDFILSRTRSTFHWVGLTDEGGKWEWVDGTAYTVDRGRWMPGQPDNWEGHGLGGTEDCAHLHWDGRLNDLHCTERLRFICHRHSGRDER